MVAGGERAARPRLGETLIGLGVLALAAVVLWQTLSIPVSPLYARVGPTVMPMMTAIGLGVLGLVLLASALRGGWQSEEERTTPSDRVALGWVVAGLVLDVVLIGPAGFTIASVVLFVCVARAFGSRAPVRDTVIALVFALVAYFGFAETLGINIGGGLVESAIETALAALLGR